MTESVDSMPASAVQFLPLTSVGGVHLSQ